MVVADVGSQRELLSCVESWDCSSWVLVSGSRGPYQGILGLTSVLKITVSTHGNGHTVHTHHWEHIGVWGVQELGPTHAAWEGISGNNYWYLYVICAVLVVEVDYKKVHWGLRKRRSLWGRCGQLVAGLLTTCPLFGVPQWSNIMDGVYTCKYDLFVVVRGWFCLNWLCKYIEVWS